MLATSLLTNRRAWIVPLVAGAALAMVTSRPSALGNLNVLTRNYNNQRTGANLSETILTRSTVNASQFGKLFMLPVDDQVYAGMLYVSNLSIAGGMHNVVYVATVNNSVYAFDADTLGPPLWFQNFNGAGRPVSHTEVGQACGDYEDFQGNIGIVGTPVIDASSQTMYFVTKTVESGNFIQRVHAVDITTGGERTNSPRVVQASVPGTGDGGTTVAFNPMTENQRAGLSLANGLLYIPWSSHCDTTPYHGWMIAYDPVSLAQTAVFNATPNGQQAAFWQSGAAPAFDASGNLYAGTSNGDWDGITNFGESVLKLGPGSSRSLDLQDWFTPSNFMTLNNFDLDLDSQGPVILPCPPACPTAPVGNLLVIGGKAGTVWLLNTNNLGHQAANDTQIPQVFQAVNLTINPGGDPALHNTTPAWVSPQGLNIYVWGGNDFLNGYRFNAATQIFGTTPFASGSILAPLNADSGGIMTVSANGSTAGTGIVWGYVSRAGDANQSSVPGNLHAFNAETLGTPLWSSIGAGDDPLDYAKGSPPMVANGKVYLASISGFVSVYGLKSNGQVIQDLAASAASNHPTATGSAPDASCSVAAAFNNSAQGGSADKWCSSAPNSFLEVDLGANFAVNRFVTEHAGAGGESFALNTRAYAIQVSVDGTNFDTIVDVGSNHKSITTDDIPPTVARFVRLNIVAPAQTTSTEANIYEFMVFGAPAPTTPDFELSVSPQQQTIVTGQSASYTAKITALNGFAGSVDLSLSGVPAGVTASFTPTSIGGGSGTSTLNLSTTAATPPGSFQMTATATSGPLKHISFLNLTINLFSAGSVQVRPTSLAPFYNIEGITVDNSTFAPVDFGPDPPGDNNSCNIPACGIDFFNNTYPASEVPSNLTVFGVPFTIGPPNAFDAILNSTVPLPAGQFATLGILATAFNGNAPTNVFTVNYTDGTSDPIPQPVSDWFTPQNFPGEAIALTTSHRNFCLSINNAPCVNVPDQRPFNLYAYFLPINPTKTVSGISLAEPRVDVLAFTLIPSSSTAPDFGLTATPSSLDLLRGTPIRTTITINKANGFDRAVDLSVQNLPRGVTADLDPRQTTSASTLTLTADSTAHVGDFVITIVGTADPSDRITRTTHVALTVRAEPTAPVAVDLSSAFQRTGVVTDGSTFGPGIDGGGTAYSANLLGSSLMFDGTLFRFGPPNVPNVVAAANQVVALPVGKFSTLQMLAAGLNGDQPSQSLQVNYSDQSSDAFSQGFNDWFAGANFPGESIAKTMAYRDTNTGGRDAHANVFLYGYRFPINSTKDATGVQLPNDDNVAVLAMSLTPPGCLYALNPSAMHAMTFNGPFNVNADCGVIVNSSNAAALNLTGAGTLTAENIQVVGGASQSPTVKVSPAPSVGDLVQPDPFRNLAPPAVGSECDHTNFRVDDEKATLEPGTYCNGITITGRGVGANVLFKPGTYLLVGGGLTVHGHAKLRGEGVTFFLTQGQGFNYGPLTIDSLVISELSAPTSGPLEGVLAFQDPAVASGPASVVKGASSSKIAGALYFRTTGLTYAVPGQGGDFLLLVADTLTITGQVIVNNDFEQLGHGSPIEHHR